MALERITPKIIMKHSVLDSDGEELFCLGLPDVPGQGASAGSQ